MTAPAGLHAAIDAVFDGQRITMHEDHFDHGQLPNSALRVAVEALVGIPDEQVPAAKGTIADLWSIMDGIADRADDEWQAKRNRGS